MTPSGSGPSFLILNRRPRFLHFRIPMTYPFPAADDSGVLVVIFESALATEALRALDGRFPATTGRALPETVFGLDDFLDTFGEVSFAFAGLFHPRSLTGLYGTGVMSLSMSLCRNTVARATLNAGSEPSLIQR